MRHPFVHLSSNKRLGLLITVVVAAAVMIAALVYLTGHGRTAKAAEASPANPQNVVSETVQLADSQLGAIKIEAISEHEFLYHKQAVGIIDFNQDLNVQVFTPYQGRIIQAYADLGDLVKKDQVLFTVESPDFIAGESNLIGAAATLDQTASALERAKRLYATQGIDQNDYETAVANQQTAEGALKAARNAVALFGKTQPEIDRIVASRQVEPALIVKSPITGRITARNAAPGLLEQPGNAPAPYSVADLSTVWMLANVPESEIPDFQVGQKVSVTVGAFPGREFSGTITAIGA